MGKFRDALAAGRFTVTAEVSPPKGCGADRFLERAAQVGRVETLSEKRSPRERTHDVVFESVSVPLLSSGTAPSPNQRARRAAGLVPIEITPRERECGRCEALDEQAVEPRFLQVRVPLEWFPGDREHRSCARGARQTQGVLGRFRGWQRPRARKCL